MPRPEIQETGTLTSKMIVAQNTLMKIATYIAMALGVVWVATAIASIF